MSKRYSLPLNPRIFLSLFLLLVFLAGCHSKQIYIPGTEEPFYHPKKGQNLFQKPLSPPETSVLQSINQLYREWQGVQYRYSGQSKNGIDCSGFIQIMYKQLFNITLPRMVIEQMKKGKEVALERIHPGDLLFFQTKPHVKHVGIYTQSGNFIHASTSRGITSSNLNSPYWSRRFLTARTFYRPQP